jgi:hypothetical protein
MGNMSYCKWQNTFIDLRDCYYTLNDPLESKDEIEARKEVINLCKNILEELEEDNEDISDDEYSVEEKVNQKIEQMVKHLNDMKQ